MEELRGILGATVQAAPTSVETPSPRPRSIVSLKGRGLSEATDAAVMDLPRESKVARVSDPEVIAKMREIAREKHPGQVGGLKVDAYSASAVIQVYDSLSDQNQKKMASLPIKKMMDIVFHMLVKRGPDVAR